jgi:hypothetical protein
VRDGGELERFRLGAKQRPCPHCGRYGTLNVHSVLRGYAETSGAVVARGRRFFCSNRHRRPGCGRTFSVLLSARLRGFVVTAGTLLRFVRAVLGGLSRKAAWERHGHQSLASGYRLWQRLRRAQPHLRTRLLSRCPPPPCDSPEPLAQLLAHMERAFITDRDSALSAFQHAMQADLLP